MPEPSESPPIRELGARRNENPLTPEQIEYCKRAWSVLTTGRVELPLDVTRATSAFTKTAYDPETGTVFLGANAYPDPNPVFACGRLSTLACLAHELAHAERHQRGISRSYELPTLYIDEAETSIHAAEYAAPLGRQDRLDLIEQAEDYLRGWRAWVDKAPTFPQPIGEGS